MTGRAWLSLAAALGLATALLLLQPSPLTLVATCVRADAWPRALFHLTNASDLAIFAAYAWISVVLLRLRPRLGIPLDWIFTAFATFILSCGVTHLLKAVTGYWPAYWLALDVEGFTAAVSLGTAAALTWVVAPKLEAEAGKYRSALAAERGRTEEERSLRAELAQRYEELRAALAERDAQARLAASQQETIQNLQIPLIRLDARSVVVPLVGVFDSERAAKLTDALLDAVDAAGVEAVLVDMTGVSHVDTATAANVVALARSARWMGATVIVTGVRPAVASTLTNLNVDLGVRSYRTIEKGLAALGRLTPPRT